MLMELLRCDRLGRYHLPPLYCQPSSIAAVPDYYVLHPRKGFTIWLFLTYQAFKNPEGII